MDIIVPAAGLSTRFPNLPPKYILRDANNCMMLRNAINPFLDKHRIVVGVLGDHVNKYDVLSQLRNEFSTSIEELLKEDDVIVQSNAKKKRVTWI